MVCSLGADQVFDYTQEDFTQNGQRYDLILDNVGNPKLYKRFYKRCLTVKGVCIITAGSFSLQLFQGPWMTMTGGNKITTFMTDGTQIEDLIFIKELLEAGVVKPVIDRCYSLGEVPKGMQYLEDGHARGKVVITVAGN